QIGMRARGRGPEVQQRLNTRNGGGSGLEVGDKRSRGLVKALAKAFVVSESECFVLSNWPAEGGPELIPLKRWSVSLIEEVRRVQSVISQKLEERPVQLIAAGLRHDYYLSAGFFAELRAIGIGLHVEFAHCVYSEQLSAGSAGGHVVFRRAGVLHTVQQK